MKRLRQKHDVGEVKSEQSSPKKLRSSGKLHGKDNDVQCCVICEGDDQNNLRKVATDIADANLKSWAQTSNNFQLIGKLIGQAADAHAGDVYYHVQCYLHLRDNARATNHRISECPAPPQFDPIATAQIVAIVEESDSVYKLSALRLMYRTLMEEQGSPCHDSREPHSTRFKEHVLNLLPEWSEYSQGKEIFISNKSKVADLLARAHDSQIGQGDALLLMRAAVILRKCCLHKQEPFSGTFSPYCLISPVPQELRSFINIILQGPSILREHGNVEADEPLHGRDKVACTISQLLIYNTYGGTHHATKTNTIRHVKERETPLLLYQGLKMDGDARLKKQIENEERETPLLLYQGLKMHGDARLKKQIENEERETPLLLYQGLKMHGDARLKKQIENEERETPLLLYQGLKMHGDARLKKQIENAHELGLSVSYGLVIDVKRAIARAVCKCHTEDGVVLPTNLRCNVFTTYDVNNLVNHNKGNYSQDEFHGTALSATNHLSKENQGEQRAAIQVDFSDKSVPELPNSYALIHPVELGNNPVFVPRSIYSQVRPSHSLVQGAKMKDELWMAHVDSVLQHDTIPEDEVITWSGYNYRLMNDDSLKPPTVIGVLPLFPDKAASPSMIKHAMQLTIQGTEFLNPGQAGVLGANQPLYAIAKQLQWTFPESLGEDKLVVMLGALHIEDKVH